MNVLITGVAGFLGSHLARRHLYRGDHVIGIDDYSSSSKDSLHIQNLKSFKNFEFHQMSSFEYCFLAAKHRKEKIDLIYNFGCPASPPIYQAKSFHTLDTCFRGTKQVLELAHHHKSRVIHASTSEIYGDPEISPQPESYWGNVNSFGPRSCYDIGKSIAETLCYEFQRKFKLDVRLVRIFNTYGEHMDSNDGRVITNFIKQAFLGDDITIYGDGNQTRSFCYVSDLINGITKLSLKNKNSDLLNPINIGNPNEFTILELAHKVISEIVQQTGSCSSNIVFNPLPIDDPTQRKPDITRAKKLLNWKPYVDLNQGLKYTIAYLKNNL